MVSAFRGPVPSGWLVVIGDADSVLRTAIRQIRVAHCGTGLRSRLRLVGWRRSRNRRLLLTLLVALLSLLLAVGVRPSGRTLRCLPLLLAGLLPRLGRLLPGSGIRGGHG